MIIFSLESWPKIPEIELIRINNDALVTIFLGLSALNKKRIGLKKIPPPIPTTPETKPRIDPIIIEIKKLIFFIIIFYSPYDLLFSSNNKPAIDKTINNKISNISLSIIKVPPINANGIEPIKKGIRTLILWFPAKI